MWERHSLPERGKAPRIALVGGALLVLGLTLAVIIASDLAAANARDLPINTWFWELGSSRPWLLDTSRLLSWFADGMRNIVIVPVVVIVLLISRQWRWAIFLVVVSQGGLLISNALKFSISRERPPFLENDSLQQHLSFPSGHTFAGFTIWVALAIITWYLLPRRVSIPVACVAVVIGLLQAPSRLIVGKHWLTDVVGSWLFGSGWLLLVWAGFLWWLAPRRVSGTEGNTDGRTVTSAEGEI